MNCVNVALLHTLGIKVRIEVKVFCKKLHALHKDNWRAKSEGKQEDQYVGYN